MDLATALHHTWTYQALVHDVFVSIENIVALCVVNLLVPGIGVEQSHSPISC